MNEIKIEREENHPVYTVSVNGRVYDEYRKYKHAISIAHALCDGINMCKGNGPEYSIDDRCPESHGRTFINI